MTYTEAAALLRQTDHILVLTHQRPDGDAIGSAAGLCAALRAIGKAAYALPNEETTRRHARYLAPYYAGPDFQPAFVVTVDTASAHMVQDNAKAYLGRIDLAIDHHASNSGYAKHTYLDGSCAACGEMIFHLASTFTEMTPAIALPLYLAVATDTGCFRYSNTTADTHRVAAALMSVGIDYRTVNKENFDTKSIQRLRLEAKMVEGMTFYARGAVAIAEIPLAMMETLGATQDDAEDVSGLARQVEGVEAGITIRELAPNEYKISLRTGRTVNASAVCTRLGGGGHAAAAGATFHGTLQEARQAILDAALAGLGR